MHVLQLSVTHGVSKHGNLSLFSSFYSCDMLEVSSRWVVCVAGGNRRGWSFIRQRTVNKKVWQCFPAGSHPSLQPCPYCCDAKLDSEAGNDIKALLPALEEAAWNCPWSLGANREEEKIGEQDQLPNV